MKLGLAVHPGKSMALGIARDVVRALDGRCEIVVADPVPEGAGLPGPRARIESMHVDAIVAIGGDGTFLRVLRLNAAPLLALNAGTVGVLSEVDARDASALRAALDRLVEGNYFIEDCMKLGLRAGAISPRDATNEVVVHGHRTARMGHFEVALDGRVLGNIWADGIILATPTGSTAYALSAFGPIVESGVEGIVLVAIAPFRAAPRAIVLDPLRTVSVRALASGAPTVAVVDGQEEIAIQPEAPVTVYRSPRRARFVRFGITPDLWRLRGKGILPWSDLEAPPEPNDGGHDVSP